MILRIKGLVIALRLGVTEQERSVAQRISIDLQCRLPSGVGESDDLSSTLDYHELTVNLQAYFEAQEICLIEHLAVRLKDWWQQYYPKIPVHFLIRKHHPNPLIQEAQVEDNYDWHGA